MFLFYLYKIKIKNRFLNFYFEEFYFYFILLKKKKVSVYDFPLGFCAFILFTINKGYFGKY